jgi:hypothetical protein
MLVFGFPSHFGPVRVLVRYLSGYATYQDLTAWSVDNFRFADNSEVDSHKGVNQDLAGLWRQSLFSTTILQTENGGVVG